MFIIILIIYVILNMKKYNSFSFAICDNLWTTLYTFASP